MFLSIDFVFVAGYIVMLSDHLVQIPIHFIRNAIKCVTVFFNLVAVAFYFVLVPVGNTILQPDYEIVRASIDDILLTQNGIAVALVYLVVVAHRGIRMPRS